MLVYLRFENEVAEKEMIGSTGDDKGSEVDRERVNDEET